MHRYPTHSSKKKVNVVPRTPPKTVANAGLNDSEAGPSLVEQTLAAAQPFKRVASSGSGSAAQVAGKPSLLSACHCCHYVVSLLSLLLSTTYYYYYYYYLFIYCFFVRVVSNLE